MKDHDTAGSGPSGAAERRVGVFQSRKILQTYTCSSRFKMKEFHDDGECVERIKFFLTKNFEFIFFLFFFFSGGNFDIGFLSSYCI